MSQTNSVSESRLMTVGVSVDAIQSLTVVLTAMAQAIAQRRPWLMTFANPATSIAVKRHPELGPMLDRFDLVAPDGIGMAVAIRLLHHQPAMRISFDTTSLAPDVFYFAKDRRLSVVLIGGLPGVADTARDKLLAAYPGLDIVATFDGYGDLRTKATAIRTLSPDIIIVGMGVLAQEKFLLTMIDQGWIGLGFTCGGYLDHLCASGTNYYPAWIDRYDLRFAYRFWKEPGRLWRRYLIEYPEFLIDMLKALLSR